MNSIRSLIFWVAMGALLFVVPPLIAQQPDDPSQLHTIRTPGPHDVFVGDVLQIRYKTQATANGVRNLRTETDGNVLSRLASVTSPLDPDIQQQPGAPYFVIVYLKAERPGQATVRVFPQMNDQKQGVTFQFVVNVRMR